MYVVTVSDGNGCLSFGAFNTMPSVPQLTAPYLRKVSVWAVSAGNPDALLYEAEWIPTTDGCVFYIGGSRPVLPSLYDELRNQQRMLRIEALASKPLSELTIILEGITSQILSYPSGQESWVFSFLPSEASQITFDGYLSLSLLFFGADTDGIGLVEMRSASANRTKCVFIPQLLPHNCLWSEGEQPSGNDKVHYLHSEVNCFELDFSVQPAQARIVVTPLGGVPPYRFQWSGPDGFEQTTYSGGISGLEPGEYCVIVTDAQDCSAIVCGILCRSLVQMLPGLFQIDPPCPGNLGGGRVCFNSLQSDLPLVWQWQGAFSGACIENAIASGTYCVEATELVCHQSAVVCTDQLIPVSPLQLHVVSQQAACPDLANGRLCLSVSGGRGPYTYTWADGHGGSCRSNLSGGLCHSVTVTDACGQSTIQCFTLPSYTPLTLVSHTINNACGKTATGSIFLSLTGGRSPFTFSWSGPEGFSATTSQPHLSQIEEGDYTVVVTDACNTQLTGLSFTVGAVNSLVQIELLPPSITPACNGSATGAIDLSVQNSVFYPPSFIWSTGAVTEDLVGVAPGVYTVTITNGYGCEVIAAFDVPDIEITVEAVITPAVCQGANGNVLLDVQGGQSPYTFSWNNGAVTPFNEGLSAGSYSVTITENGGCAKSIIVEIPHEETPPLINGYAIQNSCGDPTGSILITPVAIMEPVVFLWNNGALGPLNSGLMPGEYCVLATSALGCMETACFEVGQIPNDLVIIVNEVRGAYPDYIEGTGFIDISVEGSGAPYSYLWNTGWTGEDLYQIFPGEYSVTVTGTNGCSASISITVEPCNSTGLTLSCFPYNVTPIGSQGGTIRVNVSGGTPPYQFEWFGPSGPIPTSHYILNQITEPGTYCLSVRDQCGLWEQICRTMIFEEDCPQNTLQMNLSGGCNNTATLNFLRLWGAETVHLDWSNNQSGLLRLNSNGYLQQVISGTASISANTPALLSAVVTTEKGCRYDVSFLAGGSENALQVLRPLDIDQHGAAFGITYSDFLNAINPPIPPIMPVPISGFHVCGACVRRVIDGNVDYMEISNCPFAEFAFSSNPQGTNPFAQNICQQGGRINCFSPTDPNRFSWRVPPNFEGIYVEPGLGPVFECGCLFPLSIMDDMPPFQYQGVFGYHGQLWLYARICGSDYEGGLTGTPIGNPGGIIIGGNAYNCPPETNCDECRVIELPNFKCQFNVECIIFDRDLNGNILETSTSTVEHHQVPGNIRYVKKRRCYSAGSGDSTQELGCDCVIWQICDQPCNPWSSPLLYKVLLDFHCEDDYRFFPELGLSTDDMEMWVEPCMDIIPGLSPDEELEFRLGRHQPQEQTHVSIMTNSATEARVTAFPNPFDQKLNLQFSVAAPSSWHVQLFHLSGSLVVEKELHEVTDNVIYEFEIGHLISAGVYILAITDQQGMRYMQKVVKTAGR